MLFIVYSYIAYACCNAVCMRKGMRTAEVSYEYES